MEKKSFKSAFKTAAFKKGTYSFVLSALALVICIVFNMILGSLPSTVTQIDVSGAQLFTISEQTKQICEGIEIPVGLYLITPDGTVDNNISNLLDRFGDLSDELTIQQIDPEKKPEFISQYTSSSMNSNSVLVVSEKRHTVVDYYDIYVVEYDYDYSSGQQYVSDLTFEGEQALSSAIHYVTTDDLPVVYALSGHGETGLSSAMNTYVERENVTRKSLNLISEGGVPGDCDCIVIIAPSTDLATAELEMLIEYMENGGNMIIITDYQEGTDMTNFNQLANYYGLQMEEGIVIEGNAGYYYYYPYWLLPELSTHTVAYPIYSAGSYVMLGAAQGMTETTHRDSLTVTPLLTTSADAFSRVDMANSTTYEKTDADKEGPFMLGAAATETVNGLESKLVWFTSRTLVDEEFDSVVSGANSDLFLNCISWMCAREDAISIRGKSVYNTGLVFTSSQITTYSTIAMVVVPVLIIAAGVAVWLIRRKK